MRKHLDISSSIINRSYSLKLRLLNISPATIKPTVIRPKNCFMRDPVLNNVKYQPEVDLEQHIRESWSNE